MVHFSFLSPYDLTEEEKILLVRMAKWDYDKRTAADFVRQALAQQLALWRMEGEAQGILMTKLRNMGGKRVLWIDNLIGEGVMENFSLVRDAIVSLASRAECSHISGLVYRPGMRKLLEMAAWPEVAHIFAVKVKNAEA